MKKFFSIAVICVSLSAIVLASTSTSNNYTAALTVPCSDLGPSVGRGIVAHQTGSGRPIRIDVYRAPNACDLYVAYFAGKKDEPMSVLLNPNYKKGAIGTNIANRYYVRVDDINYYFNL